MEYLTGASFRDMVLCASAGIEKERQQINELNVFPVPDGDTGTNMSLTISAGARALSGGVFTSVGEAVSCASNALLRGARGNSGVILSLLFRGFAKRLKELSEATTADVAEAMQSGVAAAYKAVMKPTEGTILTVARLSADGASELVRAGCTDVEELFRHTIEVGERTLAQTMEMNPVLKKAGVVDAGGKGFLCILEGMLRALQGEKAEYAEAAEENSQGASFSEFRTEDIRYAYCTEFIVTRENSNDPDILREYLSGIGDCLVMVDDEELIKVHVHTNAPGAVLTQALGYGSLLTVKVENMKQQHSEKLRSELEQTQKPKAPEKKYGFVAVCAGKGMEEIFLSLGVDGIITGGQTMNPSTESILEQIEAVNAETVFVFPNNKNIIMAAQQCVPLTERKVVVIPSKTVPQGITAMMCADPSLAEEDLTQSFLDAIATVSTAQITLAARDSDFDGYAIHEGEYLALVDGALAGSSSDLSEMIRAVAERIGEKDPAVVTVFYGEEETEENAAAVSDQLTSLLPGCDVCPVFGGQPVYRYIISAE